MQCHDHETIILRSLFCTPFSTLFATKRRDSIDTEGLSVHPLGLRWDMEEELLSLFSALDHANSRSEDRA